MTDDVYDFMLWCFDERCVCKSNDVSCNFLKLKLVINYIMNNRNVFKLSIISYYNQMILKYIFSSNFKVIILYITKLVANVAATD